MFRAAFPPMNVIQMTARFVALLGLLAGAAVVQPGPALAEDEPAWIPSITLGFDAAENQTRTRYSNSLGADAPAIATTARDSTTFHSTTLRFGAELMGPIMIDGIGNPRLFVRGILQVRPAQDDTEEIFVLGDIGPLIGEQPPRPPIEADDIQGQGALVEEQFDTLGGAASLGVAFTVPLPEELGASLRIRPSFEYDVERVVARSRFAAATALGLGPPAPQCLDDDGNLIAFSCHTARAKDRQRNHRIGPGIELEVVLPGKAALRTSLYAGARVLFLLDNDSYTLRDSSGLATFEVERDEAITHIGGGLRLSWFGSSN